MLQNADPQENFGKAFQRGPQHLGPIQVPAALDQELNSVVGVVEHGLFLKMASRVIVAGAQGVKVLLPQ